MNLRRVVVAGFVTVLVAGLSAAAATPATASADQVWVQAVGRASADAPCPKSSAADDQAGWTTWAPSYGQWMNDGKGGWICERSIVWAKGSESRTPSVCVRGNSATFWAFTGSSLPPGTRSYTNDTCTNPGIIATQTWAVHAASPTDAQAVCDTRSPGTVATYPGFGASVEFFYCLSD